MKIVLTAHQFFPYSGAGTEILTLETAKELIRRGNEVEIWTGHPVDEKTARSRPVDEYVYEGITVNRYNHNFLFFEPNRNIMESEYNNLAFKNIFIEYIRKKKPALVHFFHLLRLTASAIEACLEHGLPSVFTPTDFWIICPTCQLRLSDNELCLGPEPDGINCSRHIAYQSMGRLGRYASKLPSGVFSFFINGAKKSWWPEKRFSTSLYALSKRKPFIMGNVNRMDKVLVPTRFMEKTLIENGLDPKIASFIPYGLNLKHFEKKIAKKKHGRLQIGFMGTLNEHKGAHVLLDAVKMLADVPLDVKVYGKLDQFPAYTERLKKMAADDSRIEFCGHFPNDKIGEVFAGIDVLVVPSIWYENTPLVIYSAFASGTPVIATNLGGMSEVVKHEENGLLFEKGDAKELSVLIKRLIEDRSLIGKLSKNVRPPKSISEYVDDLEGVYKDVLKKRKMA